MEVKIPVADLRQFKKESSHIRGSKIIPIYDFIKFEEGTITKTNGGEYVVMGQHKFAGKFLVQESVLTGLLDNTSDIDITFSIGGEDEITISDSRSKIKAKTAPVKDFPDIPIIEGNPILIEDDVLAAIRVAVKFTQEHELDVLIKHVFIGEKSVSATDRVIGFNKKFDKDLPELVLPISCADKIGNLPLVFHYENDRFHIFRHYETTYGFIKPDAKFFSMSHHFNTDGLPKFTVVKDDIICFDNIISSISDPKTKLLEPLATMQNQAEGLHLAYEDSDLSRGNESLVASSGDQTEIFKFLPKKMNQLLKALPESEITFHQKNGLLCYVTGDSGFTSLIMSLK